jgi:hypothetical protein
VCVCVGGGGRRRRPARLSRRAPGLCGRRLFNFCCCLACCDLAQHPRPVKCHRLWAWLVPPPPPQHTHSHTDPPPHLPPGPHDAGSYNASPEETGFFCSWGGNWETPYGRWGRAAAWWGRVEEGLRRKLARLPCSLDMGRHGSAPMLPGGAGCVVWIGASRCTIFPPPQQTQINRHSCPPPPNTPTPSSQLLPGVVQRRAAGARRAHAYCSDIRLQHARVGWGLGVAGRGA